MSSVIDQVEVKTLGRRDYVPVWDAMRDITDSRRAQTNDEFWLLEHEPVYTLGRNGKRVHLYKTGDIPVVRSDRGGQVTYHGPGQLVLYTLVDLQRRGIGIRDFVESLQNAVIGWLSSMRIPAEAHRHAPGVYVRGAKIASVGLRIRRGCAYHGLSLNVAMDLTPFDGISPCGYPDLRVCQLSDFVADADVRLAGEEIAARLKRILGDRTEHDVGPSRIAAQAAGPRAAWPRSPGYGQNAHG